MTGDELQQYMNNLSSSGRRQALDANLLGQCPNIVAFQKRCSDRPAWKKTLDAYNERVEAA